MTKIEYFYDIVSPYTYLADTQIEALAERCGAELEFRPMLLGGLFKNTGNSAPANVANKGAWMFKDLQHWAKLYDVPLNFPSFFPFNSLRVMRGMFVAADAGKEREYAKACFKAVWVENRNISTPESAADEAGAIGMDRDAFLEAINDPAIKQRLIDATDEAANRGAFGAPTFFVEGIGMFWGNDRLDLMEKAIKGEL